MKKTNSIRFFASLIVITLMLHYILAFVATALQELPITVPSEKIKTHVKRLYEEETADNVIMYENNDGSKTLYIYGESVKYSDSNGQVYDKDVSLNVIDDIVVVNNNDFRLQFSNQLSGGTTMSYMGHTLRLTANSNALVVSDRTELNGIIAYSKAFGNGTALNCSPQFSGLKTDIVLSQIPDTSRLNFTLAVDELILSENELGERVLVNNDGQNIFVFSDVILLRVE